MGSRCWPEQGTDVPPESCARAPATQPALPAVRGLGGRRAPLTCSGRARGVSSQEALALQLKAFYSGFQHNYPSAANSAVTPMQLWGR